MNEKATKAVKKILPIFKALDAWGDIAAEKATCKRGCHHCCYNMVNATLAEGAAVAAKLMEDKSLEGYRSALETAAKFSDSVGTGEDASFRYLSAKVPCVFLKDGECSVYEVRPAACRTYYVATDPAQCSPDRPGEEVGYIDNRNPMSVFVTEVIQAGGSHIPMFIGPFPSVVLAGAELLSRSAGSFKRWSQRSPLFTANSEPEAALSPDLPV